MRDVKISRAMNGFIVRVGCQTLVFETQAALSAALNCYLTAPETTERQFIERYGLVGSLPTADAGLPTADAGNGPAPTPITQFASGGRAHSAGPVQTY